MPLVTIEQELDQAPCLCLVELQGKLEVEGEEQANLDIGTLRMVKSTPILVIGKQQLKGNIVELKKPLLVMDTNRSGTGGSFVQVIQKKIVFNTRPTTVTG